MEDMSLKKAVDRLEILLQDKCESTDIKKNKEAYKTILKTLKNSVPRSEVEDRIEKYQQAADDIYIKFLEGNRRDLNLRNAGFTCDIKAEALRELLVD